MTPGEFFTLSDAKDGITTPTRVEELITLMQKEKDGEVKSADEATRQHSAIARAIAETKNADCLDHFIKLGGLWYINGWLNDALKSAAADTSGDFIEESITLLCRALEKLGLSNEMLISSGILDTVKNLCDHNSNIIKEKARELLDSWKDVDLTLVPKGVEKVDAVGDNVEDKAMPKIDEDGSLLEVMDAVPEQTETSRSPVEARKEEGPDWKGSGCLQLVEAEHITKGATCSQMTAPASLGQINLDGGAISVISDKGVGISNAVCMRSVDTPGEGIINTDNSNPLDMRDNIGDEKPGAHENTNNGKVTEKIDSTSADLELVKFTQSLNPSESEGRSSVADILMAEQTTLELETQTNIGCEGSIPMRDEYVDDAKKVPSENSSSMDELAYQRSVRGSPERTSPTLEALPENADSDIVVGLNSRNNEDYSKASAIQNLARDTKSSAMADTRSDIDLDYGLMDALEVARQVAKAVEMDMVKDGSYENISDASRRSGSPDSTNEIDSQSRNPSEESSSKLDSSPQPSTERKVESNSSEKMHSEPEECMQGVDQPQSLAQEVQVNSNKDICEFDLNQEVPYENAEFSVNFYQNMSEENGALTVDNSSSMPAPAVSGSRSHVDAPKLTGSNGWRGLVGTSAFHQLSPRRDAEPCVALPFGPSSISGKQKEGVLSIDLNLDKQGSDSNVAAAPTKSKKLDFDLNMMSDVDDAPPSSSWRLDKQNFSHLDGYPSSSSASSLFPMQPTVNIDLNEGPAMQSMSSHTHPFLIGASSSQNVDVHPFFGISSPQGASVQQDAKPIISILGARVEIERNDYSHGTPSLSNGKSETHSMEANIGAMGSYLGIGPMGSYGHPSHFAYNNTNAGPTMSFVSPMFRPGNTMTYMVNPRVGPLPQMVNSPSVVPHMYAQPPFFVSMTGPPLGLNGVLPLRPNFDLNLGFMNEGGNRQDMASRQLLSNNQGRFIGEHLSPPDAQPSSSFGKRKESESGWETYPYNMKHRYPPGNR